MSKEDYAAKYELEVRYIDELQEFMATNCSPETNTTVYVNRGINSDSKLQTMIPENTYLDEMRVNYDTLHDIVSESRTVKNDDEILAMRWAA